MLCLFCSLEPEWVIDSKALAIVVYDKFPVSKFHTLVIPQRHQKRIRGHDVAVSRFNIGINIGADAGQSIFHVHVHLIPRRRDMANPKGGVRGVIPEKQQN